VISRLEIIPGGGTLARFGEVVVWAAPHSSASLVAFLVESARNVGRSGEGGTRIADHIAGVLQARDPEPGTGFAALGPTRYGTVILLHGPVQAWDGRSWLVPPPQPGWLRTEVSARQSLAITGHGAPPPAPAAGSDLQVGVVPAAGFSLVAGAEEATTTAMAAVAGPPPSGPPTRQEADARPTVVDSSELAEALRQVRGRRDGEEGSSATGTPAGQPEPVAAEPYPDPAPPGPAPDLTTALPPVPAPSAPSRAPDATTFLPPVTEEDLPASGVEPAAPEPAEAEPGPAVEATTALAPEPAEAEPGPAVEATTALAAEPQLPEPPFEATTALAPEPEPEPGAEPELTSPPFEATTALAPEPPAPPAPVPPGTAGLEDVAPLPPLAGVGQAPPPAAGQPVVAGVHCPSGHFNHPATTSCATCGRPLEPGASQVSGPRPVLGVLLVDDGTVLRLDRSFLIGSAPDTDPTVSGGRARPLSLGGDPDVAPVHAEVRLTGWTVSVIDRGATHPTLVLAPGAATWEALRPFITTALRPGTHIAVGGRVLTMVSPWPLGAPLSGV
jgi:hypothetical protein